MKTRRIVIAVIALLSVWAVLATITAVDNENRRSKLVERNEELREEVKSQDKAYDKLKAEYAKLEAKYEQEKDEHRELKSEHILHLAYEWLVDVMINTSEKANNTNYDPDTALDKICEREGLGLYSKLSISLQAQKILSEYGIEIE